VSFLLDTNIISEVRKGPRCDPNVAAWYASVDGSELYFSVLVLGEIYGILPIVSVVATQLPPSPARCSAGCRRSSA
jgi:hypothetical protein